MSVFRPEMSKRVRARLRRARFDSRLAASLARSTHILCLGDSHVEVFRYIDRMRMVQRASFDVLVVGGATAQGLVNPNSKTDALRIFLERLDGAPRWQHVLFQLGEVDCGFVIWYRAQKHGVSVESQLETSLDRYAEFLAGVQSRGFTKIGVLSAPLPTIVDGQSWGEVANARREVSASQRERTQLTLDYNERLRTRCLDLGVRFVDVTSGQLDSTTGTIAPEFVSADPLDHHLDVGAYAKLVSIRIERALTQERHLESSHLPIHADRQRARSGSA